MASLADRLHRPTLLAAVEDYADLLAMGAEPELPVATSLADKLRAGNDLSQLSDGEIELLVKALDSAIAATRTPEPKGLEKLNFTANRRERTDAERRTEQLRDATQWLAAEQGDRLPGAVAQPRPRLQSLADAPAQPEHDAVEAGIDR